MLITKVESGRCWANLFRTRRPLHTCDYLNYNEMYQPYRKLRRLIYQPYRKLRGLNFFIENTKEDKRYHTTTAVHIPSHSRGNKGKLSSRHLEISQ